MLTQPIMLVLNKMEAYFYPSFSLGLLLCPDWLFCEHIGD